MPEPIVATAVNPAAFFGNGAKGFTTRGATGFGAGLITGFDAVGFVVVVAALGLSTMSGILPASTPVLVVVVGAVVVGAVVLGVGVPEAIGVFDGVVVGGVTGTDCVITGSGAATGGFNNHQPPTPASRTARVAPKATGVETLGAPFFLAGSALVTSASLKSSSKSLIAAPPLWVDLWVVQV